MDRRSFLRRAAVVASGIVAADQMELLERLTHVRTMFPSAGIPHDDWPMIQRALNQAAPLGGDVDLGWADCAISRPLSIPDGVRLSNATLRFTGRAEAVFEFAGGGAELADLHIHSGAARYVFRQIGPFPDELNRGEFLNIQGPVEGWQPPSSLAPLLT